MSHFYFVGASSSGFEVVGVSESGFKNCVEVHLRCCKCGAIKVVRLDKSGAFRISCEGCGRRAFAVIEVSFGVITRFDIVGYNSYRKKVKALNK